MKTGYEFICDNMYECKLVQLKPNYYVKFGNLTISIYREKKINKFQKFMLYKVFGIEVEEVF